MTMCAHKLVHAVCWIVFSTVCAFAHSAPYVPDNDAAILEQVPAAEETRALVRLLEQVRANPSDRDSAQALAHAYLLIARETSDPRFVSYAQATLKPWLEPSRASASTFVLAATAYQSSHRFDEALALLDRAIGLDLRNAQAWLTKATIHQVRGEFPAARIACRRLFALTDPLVAMSCLSGVDSLNGQLEASYRTLTNASRDRNDLTDELRGWVIGQLAEMAMRRGDYAAAEDHFSAALRATPQDVYLKGAYADLLLKTHREQEVITLLKDAESHDVLLLRLAIAGQRLGTADGARWAEMFEMRRQAARADDTAHLREHARFLLEVRNDPESAWKVAQRNWQVQREPADVLVYLQAAARSNRSMHANDPVRGWIEATGYEDRTLAELLPTSQAAER